MDILLRKLEQEPIVFQLSEIIFQQTWSRRNDWIDIRPDSTNCRIFVCPDIIINRTIPSRMTVGQLKV